MNSSSWVALSIRQPWIDLILRGIKTIEVRKWRVDRRGPILLHASMTVDWPAIEFFGYRNVRDLPRGRLVGYAELGETFEFNGTKWLATAEHHLVLRPLAEGTFGTNLQNIRSFTKPVGCPGKLLFFPVPENAMLKARVELDKIGIEPERIAQ